MTTNDINKFFKIGFLEGFRQKLKEIIMKECLEEFDEVQASGSFGEDIKIYAGFDNDMVISIVLDESIIEQMKSFNTMKKFYKETKSDS